MGLDLLSRVQKIGSGRSIFRTPEAVLSGDSERNLGVQGAQSSTIAGGGEEFLSLFRSAVANRVDGVFHWFGVFVGCLGSDGEPKRKSFREGGGRSRLVFQGSGAPSILGISVTFMRPETGR